MADLEDLVELQLTRQELFWLAECHSMTMAMAKFRSLPDGPAGEVFRSALGPAVNEVVNQTCDSLLADEDGQVVLAGRLAVAAGIDTPWMRGPG